ncbi:MAG: hypothetical protein KatS3mg085_200 [Candidatus Dojkabacteria bacterium]|nr:MAG: hypothetical protein KatS3mg085_200 [Candidatus Dojkabacteria bacterium]
MTSIFPEGLKIYWRMLRGALGAIIYRNPSKKLKIIGVTGTSGKSTTANMIYHMLDNSGFKTGVISTVGARVGDVSVDTGLHVTTPNPINLQKLLKVIAQKGAEYVVIETSSQALAQRRIYPIKFDYAVFTNITRDHLDWHKTWENYARAKARLIDLLRPNGRVILNRDDDSYNFLGKYAKDCGKEDLVVSYSKA